MDGLLALQSCEQRRKQVLRVAETRSCDCHPALLNPEYLAYRCHYYPVSEMSKLRHQIGLSPLWHVLPPLLPGPKPRAAQKAYSSGRTQLLRSTQRCPEEKSLGLSHTSGLLA